MLPQHNSEQIIPLDIVVISKESLLASEIVQKGGSALISCRVLDENGEWNESALDLWNEARRACIVDHDTLEHIKVPTNVTQSTIVTNIADAHRPERTTVNSAQTAIKTPSPPR